MQLLATTGKVALILPVDFYYPIAPQSKTFGSFVEGNKEQMPHSKKEGVSPPSKTEEKLISCKHFILNAEDSCKVSTYIQ